MDEIEDIGGNNYGTGLPNLNTTPQMAPNMAPPGQQRPTGGKGMIGFLMRKGIVKSESGATVILLIVCVICIVASILIPIIW